MSSKLYNLMVSYPFEWKAISTDPQKWNFFTNCTEKGKSKPCPGSITADIQYRTAAPLNL
jgi:hypothetical protein